MAAAIIQLMRGVVYREHDESTWTTLDRNAPPVRDHCLRDDAILHVNDEQCGVGPILAAIGVDLVVDDTEGYAYLQSPPEGDGEDPLPRLVNRRTLTYNVSLHKHCAVCAEVCHRCERACNEVLAAVG